MKQQHGKLVAGSAIAAFFGLAASAQAQPPGAPPAVPPPEMAAPMPMAPAPAVMGSDNMAGQLGFGAGVIGGTSFVVPTAAINVKYWLSDVTALMPQLQIKLFKAKGLDTQWAFSPNALLLYCPWKTTSTRLSVGGGLGLTISKWTGSLGANPTGLAPSDTAFAVRIPVYAGVEHFFTKWFSMGVAVQDDFLRYDRPDSNGWTMSVSIDDTRNITGLGFLFFYTD